MKRTMLLASAALLCLTLTASADITVTFEDQNLAPNSFLNNAGGGANGVFFSGPAAFNNRYSPSFGGIWSGWSMSSKTDGTTASFTNQYSAKPGTGAGGSSTYGVGFTFGGNTDPFHPSGTTIALPAGASPLSIDLTNTTYAYFSMKNGDQFTTPFGPGSFFQLDIAGYTASGSLIGTVDFYLADFRNGQSLIVDQWTTVDLSRLAGARSLVFGLRSSDNSTDFGMNTPAYFAADNLRLTAVPEPASFVLLALGGLIVYRRFK